MFVLRIRILGILVLAAIAASLTPLARAQEPPQETLQEKTAISNYPETIDGLKQLTGDIRDCSASKDDKCLAKFVTVTQVPDHLAWFVKVFGDSEGTHIDSVYSKMLEQQGGAFKQRLAYAEKMNFRVPNASLIEDTGAELNTVHFLRPTMLQPITLYKAELSDDEQKSHVLIGTFVYIDGGFRSIENTVWHALSTAPPLRIRMGGQVMASRLKTKIQPAYPKEARAERVAGTVRLHAIVARDGKIKEIQIISGPPLLQKAALDACLKWVYEPTLLNGEPVEVETTIDMIFSLSY